MKKSSYLVAAASIALASGSAFAGITLQIVPMTVNATLTADGWVGYELLAVADSNSGTVSALDFKNVVTGGAQGNVGIAGDIQQAWGSKFVGGFVETPSSATLAPTVKKTTDSFFIIPVSGVGSYIGLTDAPTEDNNLTTGSNPPWTQSPLTDVAATSSTNGTSYGVGSLMTFSGAIATANQQATQPIAFIIIPGTASGAEVTVNGTALDPSNGAYDLNYTFNAAAVIPEPASLGLLGLGGLALLARRRRKA